MINGIQQIGLGVPDVQGAFRWYRQNLGMDIPIFEEAAVAGLMLPYTGGEPRARHAILATSLQGGSALEIWQYTERTPQPPSTPPQLGDYGIFTARIRAFDVKAAHTFMAGRGLDVSEVVRAPNGSEHFFLRDLNGQILQVVRSGKWYIPGRWPTGAVSGCMIGVSDIEKARALYSDILGYDWTLYDETGVFSDLAWLPGGGEEVRRVLLTHSEERCGAFSQLMGRSHIELVEVRTRAASKIFEGRLWGDLGYIHLCFDVSGMARVKARCEASGYPFTVDSADSFDMGEAAGHFSYIEDPDGTLIEFVETHKIPLAKKWGWYLDLKKRNPRKPLPRSMLRFLALSRVKD